ncbi:hypothetical protein [Qipengyuania sp. JC766]|uniref:hypothetical protein n=1 Tax=Qipengyuania sp. JC766 TaxID=3232139 RepID=UPI003458E0E9
MNDAQPYTVPEGPLKLGGPISTPEKGTLPIRGDLAHIALADRFLVAHYVVPQMVSIGDNGASLHLSARDDSDTIAELAPGATFEALDFAGSWCWGCCGAEGPTGYIRKDRLAPREP